VSIGLYEISAQINNDITVTHQKQTTTQFWIATQWLKSTALMDSRT